MSTDFKTITASPVSPALGAEISGVDIAAGVDEEQFAELRQAYVDYGVIFLREQDITPDQHIEFARRWGDINVNRFFQAVATHPMIAEVRRPGSGDGFDPVCARSAERWRRYAVRQHVLRL
jgi:taurine dioxygenase